MEPPKERINLIRTALLHLEPTTLTVLDEGHKHIGHAPTSGGHFAVHIISKAFIGKNAVQRHQMVYDALGNLMNTEIHAVSINAKTPDEE